MTKLFTQAKQEFDTKYKNTPTYKCFLPVHLTRDKATILTTPKGAKTEEYYKWQFLYAIVNAGLFAKDYIGTELQLPKGNKNAASLILDAAIFDNIEWFDHYQAYHLHGSTAALDWLRSHLLAVIEFKKGDSKDLENIWNKQLKAYLKESENIFCLGVLYDTERLYLFRKYNGKFLRYSEEYNTLGDNSQTKDLSLHLPDPYINMPSFDGLLQRTRSQAVDLSKRSIVDLEVISGVHSTQINNAMSSILCTMDKQAMVNQNGFEILIQILSLKIFDEKRNERTPKKHLEFYITDDERAYKKLSDKTLQGAIQRITGLRNEAQGTYHRILRENPLNVRNENHIRLLLEVILQFQNYSFVRSQKTDLYQLVFYKFAAPFAKDQNAQFVTPLPLIEFLVNIVNPRSGEKLIDPTVGIADFLSVSYVNSNSKLDDNNIYGLDIDDQMVMLATLNMLLNGDGNAKIRSSPGYGSLLTKFDNRGELVDLDPSLNKDGKWGNRADDIKLMEFDVVLTNPPFGEDRAFEPREKRDYEMIECYELWKIAGGKKIDLGVVFLENAYRILKKDGRMGIVLSNSIASIDTHKEARKWLIDHMRIVAIFDLPAGVFAETGVNTSIIVAYKPGDKELKRLKEQNYEVFFKGIQKVGYEVKTSKRVKFFSPLYKINYDTFEIAIDGEGQAILEEEFSETIVEFKAWCKGQEEKLQNLFIKEK